VFEDIVFAFKTFRRNKTRTFLSLLGVIIGVASVIVITSLGTSATGNVKASFGSSGLDQVHISQGYMRRGGSVSTIVLNEAFRTEIFEAIPHIKKVWYKNSFQATLSKAELSANTNVSAVEYGFLEMCGIKADDGKYFSVADDATGTQTIVLGSDAALALFPDGAAVGENIILHNNKVPFGFTVIGVLGGQEAGMEKVDGSIYVPRGFYEKKIEPAPNASTVVLQVESQNYASEVTQAVRNYAQQQTGDSYAIGVMSMQSMLEQYDQMMQTISLLLSGIAAISLLVGGIGIMNIMIVTVTERKKEIGIRKAIGATPGDIRMQFLVESAAITLLGGIIGIAVGLAVSVVVVKVLKWVYVMNVPACVLAFVFSAFVGVFFGFNPASRAAKLDPVEALAVE